MTFRYGMFSKLWVDMMEAFGLNVTVIDCPWGEVCTPQLPHPLCGHSSASPGGGPFSVPPQWRAAVRAMHCMPIPSDLLT